MIRVAVVEDNADLLDDIAFNLRQAGYSVTALSDGAALDAWLMAHAADVLLLDLGLPGEDGLSIAMRMQAVRPGMGIVMLTARGMLDERIQGLDQGADVYLVKPIDMRELIAVIRTVARRLGVHDGNDARQYWLLNPAQLKLLAPNGKSIPLSHSECCILRTVVNANGHAITRTTLIEALGYNAYDYDERRLETLISRLRRKLSPYTAHGFPVRGLKGQGYVFDMDLQLS